LDLAHDVASNNSIWCGYLCYSGHVGYLDPCINAQWKQPSFLSLSTYYFPHQENLTHLIALNQMVVLSSHPFPNTMLAHGVHQWNQD
jgi:hypothetical protein